MSSRPAWKTRSNSAFRLIYLSFIGATNREFCSGSYAIISVGAKATFEKLIRYVHSQEHPE